MTSDKAYSAEGRHAALVTQLGGGAYPSTDGNNYDLTRLTLYVGSGGGGNATVSSSVTPLTILSHALGAAVYSLDIWLVVNNNTSGDTCIFQLVGSGGLTLAATPQLVDFVTMTTGTATVGYAANATNLAATFPNQNVTTPQRVQMRALFKTTAPGSLALTGLMTPAAGAGTTIYAGSFMQIRRIVAV